MGRVPQLTDSLLLQNHIAQESAVLTLGVPHEDTHTESPGWRRNRLLESDNRSWIDALQSLVTQLLSHHAVEAGHQRARSEHAENSFQTHLAAF